MAAAQASRIWSPDWEGKGSRASLCERCIYSYILHEELLTHGQQKKTIFLSEDWISKAH